MGGDHKCPVCEATFTRPQHVARHMRSRMSFVSAPALHLARSVAYHCFLDTGDRPYKCQYCGDQFARRCALVSPCSNPPNTHVLVTSYRDTSTNVTQMKSLCPLPAFEEKGLPRLHEPQPQNKSATSVFRQTFLAMGLILVVCPLLFSLSSIINLSNTAKCTQRKFRCTFVKFHRQTAPLGPGHTIRTGAETSVSNPPSPNRISSSRGPIFHLPQQHQQSEDEFILGPPPTVVPTMADALFGATPYTFPPLYPANDLTVDTDYVRKYRVHAELFESPRSAIPASSSSIASTTALSPSLYDPRPSSWLGWSQQDATDAYQQHHQQHLRHPDLISHPSPSLSPISSSMNGNHSYLPSVRYA
jgi:hypothetical protein